jgi:hypothetical protein
MSHASRYFALAAVALLSASTLARAQAALEGDANLDGSVNGTDFSILAANFDKAVTGWNQGDFNYDGAANGSDFAALAASFNEGANQSAITGNLNSNDSSPAAIPEPASATLLTIASLGLLPTQRPIRP